MPLTLMQQTLQLGFRVAIAWAGGFLIAAAVRAVLPDQFGLTFASKHGPLFIPFSRIGFWTCIWAAVTVTVLVVVRAMMGDISSGAVR